MAAFNTNVEDSGGLVGTPRLHLEVKGLCGLALRTVDAHDRKLRFLLLDDFGEVSSFELDFLRVLLLQEEFVRTGDAAKQVVVGVRVEVQEVLAQGAK